ncbi:MBL fold metallo-hydrolase [Tenggerimyces flavus]|uniref:MBL fold metallo-hydrolase n=1 Tax=Tenggerimyces flavus TaxID=1708749 RepID=A0ABV7YJV2_9ACTN|nr:MBL fold metallo-hydrolase [Tenggerimyces flavus]MBM7787643.1 phosphoribosyl 1,2-cyclic phosphodiesterase [Tenggerimyces flavus]
MKLILLGVRGSTPAPGQAFVRYGGHTSCVAVIADGATVPSLVLDAGTGLRDLGTLLCGHAFRGSIVLTHLHWDHLQGLPFTPCVDRADARVNLYFPAALDASPSELVARLMSPPLFPIGPEGLQGAWSFCSSSSGMVEGFSLTVAEIRHKGGVTHGIRVEQGGRSFAYLPDHQALPHDPAAVALASGVDVLLHDAQFLSVERRVADLYGHSTIIDALDFAEACGTGELVLLHHAPTRTDDQLDVLAKELAELDSPRPISLAHQGDVISLNR